MKHIAALLAACTFISLAACSDSSLPAVKRAGGLSSESIGTGGRGFLIKPGESATTDMVAAMIQAAPGDTIQFDCGYFELGSALQLVNTEDVRIKGCGRDQTVLSFKTSRTPEGILMVNVGGVVVEDLTVLDTGGNGIELRGVDNVTLRRVRTIWSSNGGRESPAPITAANAFADQARLLNVPCTDPAEQNPAAPESAGGDTTSPDYTVSPKSGRYGIYPVTSRNILIDEAESIGASDAGIYVGQTNNAIIRKSRAAYNVFGLEIENVQGGEYQFNLSECNVGGFLIYDLDNLTQYGDRSRMFGNIARNNNSYNFGAGGFIASLPPGIAVLTFGYDQIDIFDNEFRDHNTVGIAHVSYELFPEGGGRPVEKRIDWYTEGLHIFRNKFFNNGNKLAKPDSGDVQRQDLIKSFPALIGAKNQAGCAQPQNAAMCRAAGGSGEAASGFRGSHIAWDGLMEVYDAECPYPKDANGDPVPADARGKPRYSNEHPDPPCRYNAYKFDTAKEGAPLIVPDWFYSCIDEDNEFSSDSLAYSNIHGTKGVNAAIAVASGNLPSPAQLAELREYPSSFDINPHRCVTRFGKNLPLLPPVVIPPFVRSGDYDPAPSAAEVTELCNRSVPPGQVNFEAARVNCPTLDQYQLFDDARDARSAPNGGGVPFVLNSKLFSDYSVKYRVLYLPTGTKAVYRDASTNGANAAIVYPTGTIIAKTFAFLDETTGAERVVETRLLIKRVNSKGQVRWDGVPYLWGRDGVARLAMGGGTASVAWNFTDRDSGARHQGSTADYLIPHANQCLSCHAGEDKEAGSSPIGTKVRFMNRAYRSESSVATGQAAHESAGRNQIEYLCGEGLMAGCPSDLGVDAVSQIATRLERAPAYNKPGDSGFLAHSDPDVESRARAWLEVNCAHCHNPRGFAASTGFYLDAIRAVDASYGICKEPTAAGDDGRGGRTYDFHPANVADSIVHFRIGPEATTPGARMPPLARSVVDTEGLAVVGQWIRDVLVADEAKYPGSTGCQSGGGPPAPP